MVKDLLVSFVGLSFIFGLCILVGSISNRRDFIKTQKEVIDLDLI